MLFRIVNQIIEKFNELEPNCQVSFGKNNLSTNGPTERAVWYLERDTYLPVKHLGANGKQAFSREAQIAVHLFSYTTEKLDDYIESFLVAAKLIMNEDGLPDVFGEMIDLGTEAQNGYSYKLNITLDTVVKERFREVREWNTETIRTQFV